MSITAFSPPSFGGFPLSQIDGFLSEGQGAADAALSPARQLPAASEARAIATTITSAYGRTATLMQEVIDERGKVEGNRSTIRPDVIRAQWDAYTEQVVTECDDLIDTIGDKVPALTIALQQEALPASTDPSAIVVARQEIELAIKVSSKPLVLAMMDLAGRGGDIAAAVISPWGKLTFLANGGDEAAFTPIADAAVETALDSEDPAKRKIGAALQATRSPQPGGTVPALPESQTLHVFVLGVIKTDVQLGIVIN